MRYALLVVLGVDRRGRGRCDGVPGPRARYRCRVRAVVWDSRAGGDPRGGLSDLQLCGRRARGDLWLTGQVPEQSVTAAPPEFDAWRGDGGQTEGRASRL
jgi:hypothetical protein